MSKTYKAAIMTAPRTFEMQDMPLPEPGHGQVLIKVKAVGICTWEQRAYVKENEDAFPFWGGHEIAGVVEKIGPGVKNDIKVGDHVAVASLTRWASPPDRVVEGCPKRIYPKPTSNTVCNR